MVYKIFLHFFRNNVITKIKFIIHLLYIYGILHTYKHDSRNQNKHIN